MHLPRWAYGAGGQVEEPRTVLLSQAQKLTRSRVQGRAGWHVHAMLQPCVPWQVSPLAQSEDLVQVRAAGVTGWAGGWMGAGTRAVLSQAARWA